MLKRIIFTLVLCNLVNIGFSQSNLNDYKYVIVPTKYDFLIGADQYQLNSLTKFLFNKYGFTAIMEDEPFPEDLANNRCLAMDAKVEKESGLLKTKLKVSLKDCNNSVLFTSQLGESREKEFAKAYNLSLRDAFKSFAGINYSYKPNESITSLTSKNETSDVSEVEKLKEEIKTLKEKKKIQVPEVTPTVAQAEQPQPKLIIKETPQVQTEASNILYAQAIANGFQLVDSSPKVVYKIKATGLSNVFFVEGKQAIIYKLEANWIIEFYENNSLKSKILNIKF